MAKTVLPRQLLYIQAMTAQVVDLSSGGNAGELTGMGGCLRKPLLATCGADKMLRLWNFRDRSAS